MQIVVFSVCEQQRFKPVRHRSLTTACVSRLYSPNGPEVMSENSSGSNLVIGRSEHLLKDFHVTIPLNFIEYNIRKNLGLYLVEWHLKH